MVVLALDFMLLQSTNTNSKRYPIIIVQYLTIFQKLIRIEKWIINTAKQ